MKKGLVVKANALVNASYTLDVVESRVILLAIVEARESNIAIDANTRLRIHASDYMLRFNVEKHAAYEALKNAVTNLFGRQFSYSTIDKETGKPKKVISRWVQNISYIDEAATLEIAFTMDVIPLISRLEQQFTSYHIEQLAHVTSKYAIRLYELLISWRDVGKTPVIDLQEFRQRIGVLENEYTAMSNFKRVVLDLALAQINEHTDITASYEQHKAGRTITGFSFKLKSKKVAVKTVQPKPKQTSSKPTTEKWGLSENSAFKTLYAKCPTLTKKYVEKLATAQNKQLYDILSTMLIEHANCNDFELLNP